MRLFIHESDEAKGANVVRSRKTPGEREERGDSAAVIIRSRRTEDRVVMRADEDNLL